MGEETTKGTLRQRADETKQYRCKNLIAVLEDPSPRIGRTYPGPPLEVEG